MKYAIEYEYPGTANQQPVGRVFADRCDELGAGIWSYKKDPRHATLFDSQDAAEREAALHRWPKIKIVEVDDK